MLFGVVVADIARRREEMSDVLCYLTRMADVCGIDLAQAVQAKIVSNDQKYPAEMVKGSASRLLCATAVFF